MPTVRIVNISKKYGPITAVEKANLEIENKEYVCIIGPSGCGKTTLIKCIEGIIEPSEGEIYVDDVPISKIPIQDRGVGYVFQEIALFPHMSVYENVSYGPLVKGWRTTQAKTLINEMLDMMVLAIPGNHPTGKISPGNGSFRKIKLLIGDEYKICP